MLGALITPVTGHRNTFSVWVYDLDRPHDPTSTDPRLWYRSVRCEGTYSNRQAAERAAEGFVPILDPDPITYAPWRPLDGSTAA